MKSAVLVLVTTVALGWGILAPAIKQPQDYHYFADMRPLLIENAADTLSNLAFLAVGVMGMAFLWRERASGGSASFAAPQETRAYWVFFAGVALTSIGSAYYHLVPDDARLVWDRLPMTVAFTSLLAAVVAERISIRAGTQLLLPLVALGVASVVYWRTSAHAGAENLRPYLTVQFGSIALILLIAALYRSRYTHGGALYCAAAAYGAAKVFESFDREIYECGHLVSGHTLKHLLAALAVWWLVRMLQLRKSRQPANAMASGHGQCSIDAASQRRQGSSSP